MMNAEQIRGASLRILILSSQGIFLRRIDMIKQLTIETELERWTFVSYQQFNIYTTDMGSKRFFKANEINLNNRSNYERKFCG